MLGCEIFDDYEHIDPKIEYLIENTLCEFNGNDEDGKELVNLFHSIFTKNCNCSTDDDCSTKNCFHGQNYKIIEFEKELVLNEDRPSKDLIYECSKNCKCPVDCSNKLVQYGPRKNLKIIDSPILTGQHSLITLYDIPKGAFIAEYIGEILSKWEAERRQIENRNLNKMNYIACLNEIPENGYGKRLQTFIDPSRKGNISRYINHSCDPNCEIISVRIDGPLPKIGIFAKRYIKCGEEITFDYGKEFYAEKNLWSEKKLCFCKSLNCRKYLPNLGF